MRPVPFVAASALALWAAGCSANVVDAATDSGSESLAVLDVRAHHAGDGVDRLDASARFVAVGKDGRDGALDLLGLGWATSAPLGACVAPRPAGTEAHAGASARVDLRDLSPVTLGVLPEAFEGKLALEPRAFPDVAGLVSGVVFVVPASAAAPSRVDGVTLGVGGRLISGLELPDLPSKVRIVGAVNGPEGMLVGVRGFDVVVTANKGVGDDRVVLEVVRAGVLRAVCGLDPAGGAGFGGSLHLDAATVGGAGEVSLVVRSQRRILRPDAVLGLVDARLERVVELRVVAR